MKKPLTRIERFSKTIYDKEAILNTAYLFSNHLSIKIDEDDMSYIVSITQRNFDEYLQDVDLDRIYSDFLAESVDQQLRCDLDRKFGKLREAIYEKAFRPINEQS